MSMRHRAASIAVLGVICASLAVSADARASVRSSVTGCRQHGVERRGVVNGATDDTAVLFVHGITSSARQWTEDAPQGGVRMLGEVDRLPDVSTYTFDYSRDSLDWVTSPPVGPRLAEAINCLAAATGRKVVIVAHSMGGLAARAAQAQPDAVTGVPTSDHVGLVVTVGTPWLGSQVLAIADHASDAASRIAPPLGAGLRVAVTVCGFIAERFPTAGMCGYGGVPGSAAGRAMVPGSPELAALPPWGAGVQVHAVATRVILQVHPGLGAVPFPVDVGDVPVSVESATTSGAVDGRTYVHDCTIADYELLPVFRDRLCFHWNHLSSRPLVDFVRARVAFYVGSQPPPASTTSSEPGFSLPSGTLGVLLVLAFFYLIYRLLFRRSR